MPAYKRTPLRPRVQCDLSVEDRETLAAEATRQGLSLTTYCRALLVRHARQLREVQ